MTTGKTVGNSELDGWRLGIRQVTIERDLEPQSDIYVIYDSINHIVLRNVDLKLRKG